MDKVVIDFNIRDTLYRSFVKLKKWRPSEWGLPTPNVAASYLSLAKYNKKQPNINLFAFEKAVKWTKRTFMRHVYSSESLSFDEAIKLVERTSSPGVPWTGLAKTNGEILDDPSKLLEIRRAVEALDEDQIDVIWKNSLKEEIRPIEKIQKNKIRTFTAAPLHFTIYCIMHCHSFNQKLFDTALQHPSVVGYNTYRGGWHDLYMKLKRLPHAFELDVGEYDSSLFRNILYAICEMRFEASDRSEKMKEVFTRMYDKIVNSHIVTVDGNYVQKTTGNPSGSFNTIVDNTIALYILFCYAFIILHPEESYEVFMLNVEPLLCGDDNSFTVSDLFVNTFNAENIRDVLKVLPVEITSPCWAARRVEEISFLSRTFDTFCGGKCLPKLSCDKMLKSLEYSEYATDPARTLERIGGFLNVAWPDPDFYSYLRRLERHMYSNYDALMDYDIEWIKAKSSILTERQHAELFMGEKGAPSILKWELGKDITPIKKEKYIYINMEKQARRANVSVKVVDQKIKAAKKKARRTARKAARQEVSREVKMLEKSVAKAGVKNAHLTRKVAPKNLTKEARKIIEAIALPQVSNGLRISSGYNDIPTAADSLYEREAIVYGSEQETINFAFRSALRNAIRGIPLLTTENTLYSGVDRVRTEYDGVTGTWVPIRPRALQLRGLTVIGTASLSAVHGPWQYPGRLGKSDPHRGFWADASSVISVLLGSTVLPATNYKARLLYLQGEQWIATGYETTFNVDGRADFPFVGTDGTCTFGTYFAAEISRFGGAAGSEFINPTLLIVGGAPTLTVVNPRTGGNEAYSLQTNTYSYGHRSIKGIEAHFQQIDDLRIYGVSMLYTQTSAFTTNQGEVAMAQFEAHRPWWHNADYSIISSVNPARGKYMPVTNGSYAFLKPSNKENFNYLGEFTVDPTDSDPRVLIATGPAGMIDGAFNFYPDSDYLALALNQDPSVNRTGLLTVATTIEYTTEDQWVETRTPNIDPSIAAPAIASIRHLPQFHENEFHISDVFDWLKDKAAAVVNGVLEYGPMVLKGAAMAAPFLL